MCSETQMEGLARVRADKSLPIFVHEKRIIRWMILFGADGGT